MLPQNFFLHTLGPEEVGHGHVTVYMIMKLYGFSMELPIQKQFGSVLVKVCCQHTRNAYCWNPLVKRFQESESTPFNPWVVAVLQSLNYLAVGKAGVPTWIRLTNSKMLSF